MIAGFPEPSLEIHPSRILANNPVNITCDFRATQLPGISLQIKNAAGRALAYGDQLPLQFTQIAQEEDDGREFVCEAELEIGGDTIVKRMSANLTVFCEYSLSVSVILSGLLVSHAQMVLYRV